MFRPVVALLLIGVAAGAAHAQAGDDGPMVDPMRPPAHAPAPRRSASNKAPSWHLSAILVSPDRRLAMVNNRLVGVGGVINGARVKSIQGNVVELEVNGKSMFLRPGTHDVRQTGN